MPEMGIAERVFREHLEKGPFQGGIVRGRWRLISIKWPYAVIAVSSAPRKNALAEYAFRFELTNYPQAPPTAQPWDTEKDTPLEFERRPYGGPRVALAFKTDWEKGRALYLPCDRIAISGHNNWKTEHPEMLWSQEGDITQYLKIIYDLLNSNDYTGSRSSSA